MMTQMQSSATAAAMFEAFGRNSAGRFNRCAPNAKMKSIFLLGDPDIRPITEHLRGEFGARLVTVFAEDRRSVEGVFFNYYVFEQKGTPSI